jgi:hypothetical protein
MQIVLTKCVDKRAYTFNFNKIEGKQMERKAASKPSLSLSSSSLIRTAFLALLIFFAPPPPH